MDEGAFVLPRSPADTACCRVYISMTDSLSLSLFLKTVHQRVRGRLYVTVVGGVTSVLLPQCLAPLYCTYAA